MKKLIPSLTLQLLLFYILPFFILILDLNFWILLLIFINPLVTLINSFIYGLKSGFCVIFPILVGILFVPSVFIFYNSSALIYAIIFGVVSLIGNIMGYLFRKIRNSK